MKKIYLRMFRKSYRMLRHPRIRGIAWLDGLVRKFYARQYWKPCVRTVSVGLSFGLFCSMLPMPFQMLIATIGCFFFRGNIPVAVAACWVSNPISQIPLMLFQERVGHWFRDHINLGFLDMLDYEGTLPLVDHTVNLANFVLGVGITAVTLALLAYPLVYTIHWLSPKHHSKPETGNPA